MTTRVGKTWNGTHFRETWTTRGRSPRKMYFVDGKPVSAAIFREKLKAAMMAEIESAPDPAPASA